MKIDSER